MQPCRNGYSALFIFDFDGTLAWTPGPEEGRRLYESQTGRVWRWEGWWGRPESLLPPVVPDPTPNHLRNEPVIQELHRAWADPDSRAIVLTGRACHLRGEVYRILRDFGLGFLAPSDIVCKTGPLNTLDFKMDFIRGIVLDEPGLGIRSIHIFEDREPHSVAFQTVLSASLLADNRKVQTVVRLIEPDR